MAMVSKFGQMVQNMRVIGRKTRQMARANSSMQMVMYTKVSGKMIKHMGWATTSMQMEQLTMGNGKMTNSMGREQKPGQMELDMKAPILRGKNMEKGLCNLLMDLYILEIFSIMKYRGRESIYGLMGKLMKGIGRKIKCMGMEY
jgi:hypothetical protein